MDPGAEDMFVEVADLIDRARAGDRGALGTLLDRYRGLLRRLASQGLDPALGRRLDASDLVQQTFLEAAESFERFRGAGEAELTAWLRRILEYNLAGAARDHLFRQKRAARREASLDDSRRRRRPVAGPPGVAADLAQPARPSGWSRPPGSSRRSVSSRPTSARPCGCGTSRGCRSTRSPRGWAGRPRRPPDC